MAIVISLIIIFLAYFGISTVLTMALPYYLQDPNAPFPHLFQELGWIEIKWIVSIGAIFALCTSLLGAMFPLPRVLYAMGEDGILYKILRRVHPRTQTPLIATVMSGIFAGFMAMIFKLQQLVDMMSIGTLLAYTIVAICVLVLRYQDPNELNAKSEQSTAIQIFKQTFNLNMIKEPSPLSSNISKVTVSVFSALAAILCFILKIGDFSSAPTIVASCIVITAMFVSVLIIGRQPVDNVKLSFKVPWVPALPCLSVFINLYLMFQLDVHTWIRFVVWLVIGKFFFWK